MNIGKKGKYYFDKDLRVTPFRIKNEIFSILRNLNNSKNLKEKRNMVEKNAIYLKILKMMNYKESAQILEKKIEKNNPHILNFYPIFDDLCNFKTVPAGLSILNALKERIKCIENYTTTYLYGKAKKILQLALTDGRKEDLEKVLKQLETETKQIGNGMSQFYHFDESIIYSSLNIYDTEEMISKCNFIGVLVGGSYTKDGIDYRTLVNENGEKREVVVSQLKAIVSKKERENILKLEEIK